MQVLLFLRTGHVEYCCSPLLWHCHYRCRLSRTLRSCLENQTLRRGPGGLQRTIRGDCLRALQAERSQLDASLARSHAPAVRMKRPKIRMKPLEAEGQPGQHFVFRQVLLLERYAERRQEAAAQEQSLHSAQCSYHRGDDWTRPRRREAVQSSQAAGLGRKPHSKRALQAEARRSRFEARLYYRGPPSEPHQVLEPRPNRRAGEPFW